MGNAARKARKKAGIKFEAEPKRPTGRYLTKAERQEARRQARELDAKLSNLAAKVAKGMSS